MQQAVWLVHQNQCNKPFGLFTKINATSRLSYYLDDADDDAGDNANDDADTVDEDLSDDVIKINL